MKQNSLPFYISLVLLITWLLAGCSAEVESITTPSVTQNVSPNGGQTATPQPTETPSTINVPSITAYDAYSLIQKNKDNADFVILDVRTADEFNSGHIANAINLDYYAPDFKSNIDKLDKNKQYLIYCRTGVRGTAATQVMITLGFKNVQNLIGGIVVWTQLGYPTVS
jgi:rhodanese-related sulfurtransferase